MQQIYDWSFEPYAYLIYNLRRRLLNMDMVFSRQKVVMFLEYHLYIDPLSPQSHINTGMEFQICFYWNN